MTKAKVFNYVKEFEGFPKDENIELVEEELPELKDGDVLFEATFLSVDPYMRLFPNVIGQPIIGTQTARVTESKNNKFAVGSVWLASFGWRSHTVVNPDAAEGIFPVPDLGDLPHSLALGVLGMPGGTAYYGLVQCCKAKKGETLLVSAASGAVGNVVGQLGKILGLTVIGSAGSEKKVKLLKELGFDHVFNYKTTKVSEFLTEVAPDGLDIYYDNVGGEYANTVVTEHMKNQGRIVVVGGISTYNLTTPVTGPIVFPAFLSKGLSMSSFLYGYLPLEERREGIPKLIKYVKQGKIKYYEDITNGFENMHKAFFGLFTGENVGKAIIKV